MLAHGVCMVVRLNPRIHALSSYDRLTQEGRYQDVIANWLSAAQRLDPETGLLPIQQTPKMAPASVLHEQHHK